MVSVVSAAAVAEAKPAATFKARARARIMSLAWSASAAAALHCRGAEYFVRGSDLTSTAGATAQDRYRTRLVGR